MTVFNFLGIRFLLSFTVLGILFFRILRTATRKTFLRGAILGAVMFSTLAAELTALKAAYPSTVSFIENTAIVMVPLFEAILIHRRPNPRNVACAALALLGVAFLTVFAGIFQFSRGQLLAVAAAVLYACNIILTDRFSHQGDAFCLGMLQIGFVGLYASVTSFLFETPRLPSGSTEWGVVLALALMCTGFGFSMQPVAQSKLDSETVSLFCAFNPLSTFIFSVIFLHEPVSVFSVIGSALILSGIIISQMRASQSFRTEPVTGHKKDL